MVSAMLEFNWCVRMHVCTRACVRVCVCACVRERERERVCLSVLADLKRFNRERKKKKNTAKNSIAIN